MLPQQRTTPVTVEIRTVASLLTSPPSPHEKALVALADGLPFGPARLIVETALLVEEMPDDQDASGLFEFAVAVAARS